MQNNNESPFNLINKSKLKDMMDNPPSSQKIYEALNNEDYDVLSIKQLENIQELLDCAHKDMTNTLQLLIQNRK